MKIFRIFNKCINNAFKSVFRNFSLSVTSISCTAVTLIIVSLALLATYNVNKITTDIENELNIIVFVSRDATEDDVNNLKFEINSLSNVDEKETVYNTNDEIKDKISESSEKLKKVLDTLSENPLQSTFVIKVKNAGNISKTAEKIETFDFVTSVKYGETIVNKVLSAFDIVRNSCIIAVIALVVVTAFLISNTIKITIFSRRQEISIMRLVGTSNTVIKMPFIIEGLVLGLIGALIAIGISAFGYIFLYDYVGGKLFTNLIIMVKPNIILYQTSLIVLIVGGIVGMISSVRAVKRYLKV